MSTTPVSINKTLGQIQTTLNSGLRLCPSPERHEGERRRAGAPQGPEQPPQLSLGGTQVTPAGVAELRKALPKCKIDGPTAK